MMNNMDKWINKIHHGDTLELLKQMPDESVDMVITSPPYWSLRDYGKDTETIWGGDPECDHIWGDMIKGREYGRNDKVDPTGSTIYSNPSEKWDESMRGTGESRVCQKCNAYKCQFGLEHHYDLYLNHLCDIMDDVKKVLRNTGTLWVNIGDTYSSGSSGKSKDDKVYPSAKVGNTKKGIQRRCITDLVTQKSLIMIPFRFAIEMVNRGWILRNTIIWHRPNAMPSSADDRFTVDFEYLFFFVKNKKYYFKQQFEPYTKEMNRRGGEKLKVKGISNWDKGTNQTTYRDRDMRPNLQGKNKRTTWSISTVPSSELHFAQFPESLLKTPIDAGCPQWVCKKCGKAREQILQKSGRVQQHWAPGTDKKTEQSKGKHGKTSTLVTGYKFDYETTGWTSCNCDTGFEPGIVLDIFAGSGTTCLVAKQQGRNYIGLEINPEYCKMARKRVAKHTSINKWITKPAPPTQQKEIEKKADEIDWQL